MIVITKGHEEFSRAMEIFYIMIVVTFTQLYEFVKTHQTILLKRIDFTACKVYSIYPAFFFFFYGFSTGVLE